MWSGGVASKELTLTDKEFIFRIIYTSFLFEGPTNNFCIIIFGIEFVAHDWGGPVAYSYAAAHPEDERKMIILDTLLPGFGFGEAGNFHQMEYGIYHFMQ